MEHNNQRRNRGYNTGSQQQGDWNQQEGWNANDYNRASYRPDNDDNQNYNYRDSRYDLSSGPYNNNWGYQNRNEERRYGNASYDQPYNDARDQNDQYGYGTAGGNHGFGKGNREYSRTQLGHNYGTGGTGYQNQGYGSSADHYRSDYQRSDRNRYTGSNQHYGSNRQWNDQGERTWWDRTRDEVASWFGDDDAERRRAAERNRDMGQHFGKGPRGYQRSQERIKEDVCDRLSLDRMVDASNIEVEVQGNEVILSGKVNSKEEKRRAEDLVERIMGVSNVENRLRVDRSGADSDSWHQNNGL